jgi:hypothetical protein
MLSILLIALPAELPEQETDCCASTKDVFFLFNNTGVWHCIAALSNLIIPNGTWLLSDSYSGLL